MVPALGNEKRKSSRSILEFKVSHQKQSIKMKIERGQSKDWRICLETQSKENALIRDLQNTETLNPFNEESKKIIHNLGNVEYCELCDVSAKTQCSSCAKYWADGVVSCTCGSCVIPSEETRLLTKEKFDLLSIPHSVIKKESFRGARHGKTDEQREYHQANVSLRKAKQPFRAYS